MVRPASNAISVPEELKRHLCSTDKEKNRIYEEFYPFPSKERDEFGMLMERYFEQVNNLIARFSNSETDLSDLPFVVIGSKVVVEDPERNETFSFTVVSPYELDMKGDYISYISPVGRALLLKKTGQEILVKAPGGVFRYRVLSISLK